MHKGLGLLQLFKCEQTCVPCAASRGPERGCSRRRGCSQGCTAVLGEAIAL